MQCCIAYLTLRAAVAVVDQPAITLAPARRRRLLRRVEHEVGLHGTSDPPADDALGENVDKEART